MPKKVLMFAGPIHPNPPLKGAAVETWMYEVSKRLISYEPHIISIGSPFYPEREYKEGIYFYRINFSKFYKRVFQKITKIDPLSYPKRILKLINEVKPDVIHVHNTVKWFLPLMDRIDKNIKKILHFHNEITLPVLIKIDAFLGCSNYIVELYKNNPRIKAKYFQCIYNGVDLSKFIPYWQNIELKRSIRKRFKINESEFVVLFVGRISPEKGVEHFIETAIFLKNVKNLRFIIVGEIAKKGARAEYAEQLIKVAKSLENKVIFTDVFSPAKMNLIYLLGDVVFLPSNFEEPFGMTALEAMATGIPVITRAKGGLKEYIKHEINGFFVREESIAKDASKIIMNLIKR